jgi:hypothetical protein
MNGYTTVGRKWQASSGYRTTQCNQLSKQAIPYISGTSERLLDSPND